MSGQSSCAPFKSVIAEIARCVPQIPPDYTDADDLYTLRLHRLREGWLRMRVDRGVFRAAKFPTFAEMWDRESNHAQKINRSIAVFLSLRGRLVGDLAKIIVLYAVWFD